MSAQLQGGWSPSHRKLEFTTFWRMPFLPSLVLCPTCSIEGAHRILVATSEGLLYVGSIDPREGGECKITKEFGWDILHSPVSVVFLPPPLPPPFLLSFPSPPCLPLPHKTFLPFRLVGECYHDEDSSATSVSRAAIVVLSLSKVQGCHSHRLSSHSCDRTWSTCTLRKGWSRYAFLRMLL